MSSGTRITAAFLLGAGAGFAFVAICLATGVLSPGGATGAGVGLAITVAIALLCGGVAGLIALRRVQAREEARIRALAEKVLLSARQSPRAEAGGSVEEIVASARKACEALGERVEALMRCAADLAGGEDGPLGQLAREAEARRGAASETVALARALRDGIAARASDIELLGLQIRESAEILSRVDGASGRNLELITGLAVSIEQAGLAVKEGDKTSRAIVRDLDSLSSGVRTARSSLDAMKDGAEHACADARHVANTMASLELESQRIGEAIEAVISGSDAVMTSNGRILGATESLESRLGGIDDVIVVIRNLADRTKLLSINASIIATEAGEHGRAFGVVANEIKDLAASTSRAIAEISSILSTLKDGFADTVGAIAASRDDVGRGVGLARSAVEMIRSIPEQVHVTSALSNEIVMRNEEQLRKGAEIGAMFERMSEAIAQLEELLQRQMRREDATAEIYVAIGRSSEHVHRSAKEQAGASAELSRVVRNVNDTFVEAARRAAGGAVATEGLIQALAEAERQSDELRAKVETARSRLSEIVQLSRDLGGAGEP